MTLTRTCRWLYCCWKPFRHLRPPPTHTHTKQAHIRIFFLYIWARLFPRDSYILYTWEYFRTNELRISCEKYLYNIEIGRRGTTAIEIKCFYRFSFTINKFEERNVGWSVASQELIRPRCNVMQNWNFSVLLFLLFPMQNSECKSKQTTWPGFLHILSPFSSQF